MKRVAKAIPAIICASSLFFLSGCDGEKPIETPSTDVKPASATTEKTTKPSNQVAARNLSEMALPADAGTTTPRAAAVTGETGSKKNTIQRVKPTDVRVDERVALNPDGTVSKSDPSRLDRAAKAEAMQKLKTDNSQYVNPDAPVVVRAEPAQLYLGEVSTGDVGTGTITLINSGDKPLRLIECKSSCGCTTTNCPTGEEIPAGGSLELPVRLTAGAMPQESMSKSLTYIIEDHPMISVPVSAKVVSYITVSPDVLDTDVSLDGKLTLHAIDEQPFVITSMIPPIITEFATEPAIEHTVEIDWDAYVNSGYRGGSRLVFYTSHEKCRAAYANIRGIKAREAQAKFAEARGRNAGQTGPGIEAVPHGDDLERPFRPQQVSLNAVDLRLHAFTKIENVDGMKEAITEGANVEAADASGKAPLHIAALEGKVQAIDALLAAGAAIEATDRGGRTPLMWAVESRSGAAVEKLIDAGANLAARDETGMTPLMWAAGFGNAETLDAILSAKPDLAVTDDHGMTPLMWAASFGDGERVKILVDAGIDVNLVDGTRGCSALMYASRSSGPLETVQTLLDAGADLNVVDVTGRTALSWAALLGTPEKVQLLLSAGSNVLKEDFRGWTPLRYAENRRDRNGPMIISLLRDATAKASGEAEKSAAETDAEPIDPQARR